MTAATSLDGLSDVVRRLESRLGRMLPETPKTEEAAGRLQLDRLGATSDPATLEQVAETLRRIDAMHRWTQLPARVRRLAPRALLLPPEAIRLPGVLARCVEDAMGAAGMARLRSLIACYMQHYAPARPGIALLAGAIRQCLAGRTGPHAAIWKERDRVFGLFDATEGPRRLASTFLAAPRDVGELLATSGLDQADIIAGGFAGHVHDALCGMLAGQLAQERSAEQFARLMPLLENKTQLRFDPRRAVLAAALLRPWTGTSRPDPALRQALTDFLLRHLQDPRLAPQRWLGVPYELRAVFLRWLAPAALQEFFELISDRDDTEQWEYRRAFWTSVANAEGIEDAWVVLSSTGRRAARRRLGETIGCGEITGGFAGDKQSVILMRIGGLVLAEISHNGRLHAWRATDPRAPRLGLPTYDRTDVYRDGLDFPRTGERHELTHRMPAIYWWQERAAELIAAHGGPRLNRAEWHL